MLSIEKRVAHYDTEAFVAVDTVEPLIERVQALWTRDHVERTLTRVRYYVGDSAMPDVQPGLAIDTSLSHPVSVDHESLWCLLTPGVSGFGFGSALWRGKDTEEVARRRSRQGQRRETLHVAIEGFPNGLGSRDRITLTEHNEYDVVIRTIIAFDPPRRSA